MTTHIEQLNGGDILTIRDKRGVPCIDTTIGLLPQDALEMRVTERDDGGSIAMAREYYYHGTLVRRDCWVTLKCGLSTLAAKGN